MKRIVLHRFLPALLGAALALGLAACGAEQQPPPETGLAGATEILSASKTAPGGNREITDASSSGLGPDGAVDTPSDGQADPENVPTPAADLEPARESLTLLYEIMAWDDDFAGAVAYLGYRERGGSHAASGLDGGELPRADGGSTVFAGDPGGAHPRCGLR